ncbi:MAG: hypothetical protein ACYTXE_35150 [Nostoc sp.]
MKLSPLYIQWEQEAQKQGQRMVVENLPTVRFGRLDEQLATNYSAYSRATFTRVCFFTVAVIESLP